MQESLDSLNNSPDKKKKGLKGAFTKVISKVCNSSCKFFFKKNVLVTINNSWLNWQYYTAIIVTIT